jgi:hydrophobe/amphiphile efflux-1 (HAE1) family protein
MMITDVCIKKPVLAWMIMAGVVLFGLVAGRKIGVSQFPNIDRPALTVSVTWAGAAPEVMETDVVDPLEEALTQVEDVTTIRSTSRLGRASITIELDISRNIDAAFQDVQAKVAQTLRHLPTDIDPPTVSKQNLDDSPILMLALTGTASRQALSDFARYRVKERLQTVTGVGEIALGGWLDRNIRIWVDAAKLDAHGVTVAELTAALQRQHVELPAGQLIAGGRETDVRILGEALDLTTLRHLVVAKRGEAPVYLEDLALVEDGFEDERTRARLDGEPAQGIMVRKQHGSNAVEVAQGVLTAMEQIKRELPPNMDLKVNFDSTRFIKESVDEIEYELVQAVVLTGVLCWLFLGSLSSTLNVILAIPMSLLGTVGILYFAGFTLNMFTLLGLGLAVGIVVDDAIMVLENIIRHRENGEEKLHAARFGTREIAFAALASTIAVVAVFSPVLFVGGLQGRFLLQFGITLCVAILLSYLEAVTMAPSRCSQFLEINETRRSLVGRAADASFAGLAGGYRVVLGWVLKAPVLTLLIAAVMFAASLSVLWVIPKEFVPSQDQNVLMVRYQTAVGSSLEETDGLLRRAEARIAKRPEVEHTTAMIGGFGAAGVNSGMIFVVLKDKRQRDLGQAQVQALLRKDLRTIAGFDAKVLDTSASVFTAQRAGYAIEASVRGGDWDGLLAVSQQLQEKMRASGYFVDVDSDANLGMPELRITPDRARCADLGVSVADVANSINALVGGVLVGKYTTNGKRIDIGVRLLADQRTRPEDLSRLHMRTANGDLVPLSSLVTAQERPAQQSITRADRERAVSVFAGMAAGHSQQEGIDLMKQLGQALPAGSRLVFTGGSATFNDAQWDLLFALCGGIIAAYMVLASQFNSFLHPVTVLSVLPLSIIGAVVSLWAGNQSLNMFSAIGILLLMGIAKKNSIILVDYTNQLRGPKHGNLSALDALLRSGPIRLRPILMTSLATMCAAIPLALGLGPGGEIRSPMAIAVIGGVFISTFLSLLVVPALYLYFEIHRLFNMIFAWHALVGILIILALVLAGFFTPDLVPIAAVPMLILSGIVIALSLLFAFCCRAFGAQRLDPGEIRWELWAILPALFALGGAACWIPGHPLLALVGVISWIPGHPLLQVGSTTGGVLLVWMAWLIFVIASVVTMAVVIVRRLRREAPPSP